VVILVILLLLGALAVGPDVGGEEQKVLPRAGVGIRAATPEEVKARLKQEEERINAEPPIEGLPRRLSYYLRTQFPRFSVLTREEATEGNLKFATSELGQPSPFICFGDFDGDGLEDTALLLREQTTNKLHLVAFHQIHVTWNPWGMTSRDYRAYRVTEAGPAGPGIKFDRLVVACNRPGQFKSLGEEVTLILKNHSISFEFSVYYFVGGYQSLVVSD
jgi:hypothetical protein